MVQRAICHVSGISCCVSWPSWTDKLEWGGWCELLWQSCVPTCVGVRETVLWQCLVVPIAHAPNRGGADVDTVPAARLPSPDAHTLPLDCLRPISTDEEQFHRQCWRPKNTQHKENLHTNEISVAYHNFSPHMIEFQMTLQCVILHRVNEVIILTSAVCSLSVSNQVHELANNHETICLSGQVWTRLPRHPTSNMAKGNNKNTSS